MYLLHGLGEHDDASIRGEDHELALAVVLVDGAVDMVLPSRGKKQVFPLRLG